MAEEQRPSDAEIASTSMPHVPPMEPLDDAWLKDADDLDQIPAPQVQAIPAPAQPGKPSLLDTILKRKPSQPSLQDQEPGKTKPTLMRGVLALSLCGIAVLAYLEYGGGKLKTPDLLGSRLPATGVPSQGPEFEPPVVDPRLSDGEPLGIGLAALPGDVDQADIEHHAEQADLGALQDKPAASLQELSPDAQPAEAPVEPAHVSRTAAAEMASAAPADAPSKDAQQLAERMAKIESMLAMLNQQLAEMKTANAAAMAQQGNTGVAQAHKGPVAPALAKPASEAPQTEEMAPQRPAPKRVLVKAEPSYAPAKAPAPVRHARPKVARTPVVAKAEVAEKPKAPSQSGQLVSVDMWNGVPSVVVASGIPGDRRVRVLRPGDVVEGMSVKAADAAARTATFVAPGSQGLMLSVGNGG